MNKKGFFILPAAFLILVLIATVQIIEIKSPANQGLPEVIALKNMRQKTDFYITQLEDSLKELRPYNLSINQNVVTIYANVLTNDKSLDQINVYKNLINDSNVKITPNNLTINKKSVLTQKNDIKITNVNNELKQITITIYSPYNITSNLSNLNSGSTPVTIKFIDGIKTYENSGNIDLTKLNTYTYSGATLVTTIKTNNSDLIINTNQDLVAFIELTYLKNATVEYANFLTITNNNLENKATINLKN